jgi:hypothetical protein
VNTYVNTYFVNTYVNTYFVNTYVNTYLICKYIHKNISPVKNALAPWGTSSPPVTEETGAIGREIKSRQDKGWLVALKTYM